MKRKYFAASTVAILVLLAILPFARTTHAQQNSPVKLSLEGGYQGYYRNGQWFPILIKVSNTGPDISGELRVSADATSGLAANAYATSVELATQSNKEIFLNIALTNGANQIQVELVNENSGVIATATQNVKMAQPTDMLYALITESPRGAIDLTTAKTGIGDVYQANWRIDNIPATAQALDGLNVLMLSDVDSGNLTLDQRKAIQDWVTSGGHLVVSGGPNWQKTQAGVTDLLPLTPNGTTTLASLPSLGVFAGSPKDQVAAQAGSPIIVTQGALKPDAQVLAKDSDMPLLVRHAIGLGYVDYLAVDPGLEPYPSWGQRDKFWSALFNSSEQKPSWSFGIQSADRAISAANFIKGLRLPDVLQLIAFLGFYIVIIGPVNYLALRRIGRPEWAWFSIPIIVVVMSVFAYITGFSLRGTQATINRIAMVQVWPDSSRAQIDSVIGVLAPRRALYDVAVGNNLTLQPLQATTQINGPSVNLDPGVAGMTIYQNVSQNSSYEARQVPVDAGTTAAFTATGYIQAMPLQGKAVIRLTKGSADTTQTTANVSHITGSVTNSTGMTLYNAVVLALGSYKEIGTLQPGESHDFSLDLPARQQASPASAVIGNASAYINNYNGGYPDAGLSSTIHDIMGSTFVQDIQGLATSLESQEMWRRENFLRALTIDTTPGGGRGTNVYLAGWTNTSPVDVTLKDIASTTEDTTLYLYRLPTSITATSSDGIVELPSAYLTWEPTAQSTQASASPYQLVLTAGDHAVLRFKPLPAARLSTVSEIRLVVRMNNGNGSSGTISLWDWTANNWVSVNTGEYVSRVTNNPQRFIGPENAVDMRLEPSANSSEAYYDSVDVTLYGQLQNQSNVPSQGQ